MQVDLQDVVTIQRAVVPFGANAGRPDRERGAEVSEPVNVDARIN